LYGLHHEWRGRDALHFNGDGPRFFRAFNGDGLQMSKTPTVSFIVPVYKKPSEVFEKCLRSLFDMSLKDIEVICVFDGPDEALQLVTASFPKVKTIVVEHGGAPKARNAGLEAATGKFVWFWDADCYIKPDHAKRMVEEFEAVSDADFVYSGFEMAEGGGTQDGESFDRYSLECGNFISSMAPIRREKAFKWDESLEAGQDWDYWLTATEKGLKGVWVEGSGFVTDTYKTGLSSDKWSMENRDKTILTIRHKHGVPDREIGVFTAQYRERGIKLARILGADIIKPTGLTPTVYKMIFNLGYSFMSRFDGVAQDVTKIQYWLPGEIEGLKEARYSAVMETIRIAKGVTNLCNTDYEKNRLGELGVTAQVMPLPLLKEDLEKASTDLPKEFSILVDTDEAYAKLLKEMEIDLPHIKFHYAAAKVADFSCFLSFHQFATLDNGMLIAHVNGRNVISNVQAHYCGFTDPDQSWEGFKKDLYDEIREIQAKPFNKKAQEYYTASADPEKFKEGIKLLLPSPKLEVIA
jgi:glycosyltransferase involved in cell wall biosynthesis